MRYRRAFTFVPGNLRHSNLPGGKNKIALIVGGGHFEICELVRCGYLGRLLLHIELESAPQGPTIFRYGTEPLSQEMGLQIAFIKPGRETPMQFLCELIGIRAALHVHCELGSFGFIFPAKPPVAHHPGGIVVIQPVHKGVKQIVLCLEVAQRARLLAQVGEQAGRFSGVLFLFHADENSLAFE